MAKENEELPFPGHVVGAMEHFYIIKHLIMVMLVWTQEVVISNPESQVIVGTFDVVKAVRFPVRNLVGTVQPFHDLFEWAVFFGNSIVVGKSNHLSDLEREVLSKLLCEFHGGKRISTIAISDKFESFRQFLKAPEGHAHGKNAGSYSTIIGYLVTDDGAADSVHNEPDVGFDAADFDVGFIRDKSSLFGIGILINKRFDADSGSLAVVGDLLVGDLDVIEILECLTGFAE